MLTVLSWNILHGGGKRCDDIVLAIEHHKPDIVVLQEFRQGKNQSILQAGLREMGLSNITAPPVKGARDNGLLIASHLPVSATVFPQDQPHPLHAMSATIDLDGGDTLRLINLHFPQKRAQLPFFEALLTLPDHWLADYSMLLGDFNCGIPLQDSDTKTFYATHLFQRLLQCGWIDSWRSRYPRAREYSWSSARTGNGFRYDHTLSSPPLDQLISKVTYHHDVRERKISDHSMMTVNIDII